MIILDTNVLSELMRPDPDVTVAAWTAGQPMQVLFTTTICEAEILFGIALLPAGKRKEGLARSAREMFAEDFAGRILSFDSSAAAAFARIESGRRRLGKPIAHADMRIAGIASSRGASVATRNAGDFADCGISVVNPWTRLPSA